MLYSFSFHRIPGSPTGSRVPAVHTDEDDDVEFMLVMIMTMMVVTEG
jgi:hypothetical protein